MYLPVFIADTVGYAYVGYVSDHGGSGSIHKIESPYIVRLRKFIAVRKTYGTSLSVGYFPKQKPPFI